jgi:hypothetical protein
VAAYGVRLAIAAALYGSMQREGTQHGADCHLCHQLPWLILSSSLAPSPPISRPQGKSISLLGLCLGRAPFMVQTVETIQVYLNERRQGVVTCMYCGVKYPVNMSNYTNHHLGGKSFKAKCNTCKKDLHVKFELRKYRRIDVDIPGKISHLCTREERININIVSLSVVGIGFFINDVFYAKDGDICEIEFQLDDESNSVICEEIIIKNVNDRFVGAEFYHSDRYNYELDFYVMSGQLEA